ncbi:hypothetical protein N0V84_006358 [Fusarium piperis]|uniref:Methyltransferase n=1 Tax=Fusarium piperis TaxID=1435070 RepID=A0A9W8WC82_9HYPO|nr:hypothetical protein N0V84_006358 [Fusarium piperis]
MTGNTGPRDSLSDYEFSFEAYLDYTTGIEVDSNPWSRPTLDTASVAESIYEFHKENGRTYHAYRAGSYYYPNDLIEVERLNTQHETLKILLDGRSCLAPFDDDHPPHKVLDIATGSGHWAIDLGDEFPEARIIGTDLSPIQSELVPPNVEFIIDDAVTMGCWSDMTTQIIEPAFERLRPGGWIECQELEGLLECDDESVTENNPFKKWCNDIVDASIAADRPLPGASSIKKALKEAGFVDIHEKIYKIPINGWPKNRRLKRFGELWHANVAEGLQALSYGLLHRVKGMTKEEIEVNLIDVRRALADHRMHGYQKFYVVWGRKPEDVDMR